MGHKESKRDAIRKLSVTVGVCTVVWVATYFALGVAAANVVLVVYLVFSAFMAWTT